MICDGHPRTSAGQHCIEGYGRHYKGRSSRAESSNLKYRNDADYWKEITSKKNMNKNNKTEAAVSAIEDMCDGGDETRIPDGIRKIIDASILLSKGGQ